MSYRDWAMMIVGAMLTLFIWRVIPAWCEPMQNDAPEVPRA